MRYVATLFVTYVVLPTLTACALFFTACAVMGCM